MSSRSAAQIDAARENGRKSRGPVTDAGKARAAKNARTYGFRSTSTGLYDLDDTTRLRELETAIQDRYQPACPLEAAICARMTMAMWRAERADILEAEYWCLVPYGVTADTPLRNARVLQSEEAGRRHGLQTILRYQAEAMNAFTRALRALTLLRKEKSEPAPEPANENEPADGTNEPGLPADCTNEPKPPTDGMNEPEPPAAPEPETLPPPDDTPQPAPSPNGTAAKFYASSELCRQRIEQVPAGPEPLDDSTDEPGLSQPSHTRRGPRRG